MKIAIGSDHAGYELKEDLEARLVESGYSVHDLGTYGPESVDYPDYAHPVALSVESGTDKMGILICGSANGVCMTANKHAGIRAALCWTPEIAGLARQHNDANIICLPARFITTEEAWKMVEKFLHTPFEGGRHQHRVDKIGG